ncbi:MAG: PfkB family carbohydrate kinase [Promethearchaeota archaeon]
MQKKVLTFGEIMLRLSPPYFKRFSQANSFDVIYGGGEANVAVSLSNFGIPVDYITRLPDNDVGDACIRYLKQFGINTNKILRGGERIGIYFLEIGASTRPSKVIYDRAHSAISNATRKMFNWDKLLEDVNWLHWTGITPAISQNLADICLDAIKVAKTKGISISCDLNYRSKLWNYGKDPSEIMPGLVKFCDYVIGNEEDADKVLGIKAPDTDISSGRLDPEKYEFVVKEMHKKYSNLKTTAITLRGSISASHNTWAAILYNDQKLYISPHYDITHIVDRVGGGDSFVAGLIYGFHKFNDDYQKILNFAVAASCLKHTIFGDFNLVSVEEVLKIMEGNVSGRVSR